MEGKYPCTLFGGADLFKYSSGAIRARENSKLLVKCLDAAGNSFTERTETHDISETGISFYLKNQVWVDTHLTITIASSNLFGRLHTASAKVVSVKADPSGRQLVAACFDD
jgi:hypothetical protein